MKKIIINTVIIALASLKALALPMTQEEAKVYLSNPSITMHPDGISIRGGDDIAFVRYVLDDWQNALLLIEKYNQKKNQSLIMGAAEFLSPNDYVKFLNGVCDLAEKGKIENQTLCDHVISPCGLKAGFLAYNYDHPDVTAVINRLETIAVRKNLEYLRKDYFEKIKTGEDKKQIIQDKDASEEGIPETMNGIPKGLILFNLMEKAFWVETLAEKVFPIKREQDVAGNEIVSRTFFLPLTWIAVVGILAFFAIALIALWLKLKRRKEKNDEKE